MIGQTIRVCADWKAKDASIVSYHAPDSLEDALAALTSADTRLLGGGTDIFPPALPGKAPTKILDVTNIREMRGVSESAAGWRIGAATSWSELINHPLPPAFDGLKAAARTIGSVQIQNTATIGGNLCNASPAADGVPSLLALEAKVEITSAAASRWVALEKFLIGPRRVDLKLGEILTAVIIPPHPGKMRSSFLKLGSRKYLVISIAMVATLVEFTDSRVRRARLAVGACSPTALRLRRLENELRGMHIEQLSELVVSDDHLRPLSPINDVRGSAEYRLCSVKELIRRALAEVAEIE